MASLFSLISSKIIKHIGMQTIMVMMLMGALINSVFMISWTPDKQASYVIFIMAVAFAFTNSLATAQVRAVFGIFFPDNSAAYSAANIFETIGLVLGSVLSIYFCTDIKIYGYVFLSITGIVSYVYLEMKKKSSLQVNQTNKEITLVYEMENKTCIEERKSF